MSLPKEFIKRNASKINRIGKNVCVFLPEESKGFYHKSVIEVSKKLGCESQSFLDLPVGNGLENVWKNMVEAGIVIVDITHYNPSVMFELGATLTYRDAQEVILICDEKYRGTSIPFNISPLNINYYDPSDDEVIKDFEEKLYDDMESILWSYIEDDPIQNAEAQKLMDKILRLIEKREWDIVEVLFEKVNDTEPNNWKVHKEWARFFRFKGKSFQNAFEKINLALDFVKHPAHKSEVYLEQALLYDSNKDRSKAEIAFNQAEELNKKDKDLYFAWAEFHVEKDELGEALKKILKIKEIDNEDEMANLWFDYLSLRIKDPGYKKTFVEYKAAVEKPGLPVGNSGVLEPIRLPHGIDWEEFRKRFFKKLVYGHIDHITNKGIAFVYLNRNIKGVLNTNHVRGITFKPKQRIIVKIMKAYTHNDIQKVYLHYHYQ